MSILNIKLNIILISPLHNKIFSYIMRKIMSYFKHLCGLIIMTYFKQLCGLIILTYFKQLRTLQQTSHYRFEQDVSSTKSPTHSENHSNIIGLPCKISKDFNYGLLRKQHFCVLQLGYFHPPKIKKNAFCFLQQTDRFRDICQKKP